MAQITHEGASKRLSFLKDVTSHLHETSRLLHAYEESWGAEGFIHSVSELVSTAQLTLETSIIILQDYRGELRKSTKVLEEFADGQGGDVPQDAPERPIIVAHPDADWVEAPVFRPR